MDLLCSFRCRCYNAILLLFVHQIQRDEIQLVVNNVFSRSLSMMHHAACPWERSSERLVEAYLQLERRSSYSKCGGHEKIVGDLRPSGIPSATALKRVSAVCVLLVALWLVRNVG